MAIILDSLKETLDFVALLKERANFIARVSTLCENFFARKVDAGKQFKHRFRVVDLFVDQDHVNFGILAAA